MNIKLSILLLLLFSIIYVIFYYYIIETHIELPEGSWSDTCTVLTWSNPQLSAECIDNKGRPNITSINVNNCLEIEIDPTQTEKRNEGMNLEHHHYPRDRGMYFHIHKLINDNGILTCDTNNIIK